VAARITKSELPSMKFFAKSHREFVELFLLYLMVVLSAFSAKASFLDYEGI
jgi:hypothetical protein